MRSLRTKIWLAALAGALIVGGFGLPSFLGLFWIWEHHMFIIGVTSWFPVMVLLSVPLALMATGVFLLVKLFRNETE